MPPIKEAIGSMTKMKEIMITTEGKIVHTIIRITEDILTIEVNITIPEEIEEIEGMKIKDQTTHQVETTKKQNKKTITKYKNIDIY